MNNNILVTGGAGYIGSHVCKELNDKGFTPIVIDNLSTGKIERLKWGTHFINNISDTVQLSEIMDRYSPKSIMHFAAFSNVAESMEFPEKYYCNNVIESIQLLNNVINLGIKNIIYSSTCAVYGNPEKIPIDENIQPNPINPYGESKFIIEAIGLFLEKNFGKVSSNFPTMNFPPLNLGIFPKAEYVPALLLYQSAGSPVKVSNP